MGLIKKTTTLFLMFLLAVALSAYGGSILFYQSNLGSLTEEMSVKNQHIKSLEAVLESFDQNYTQLRERYDLKVQREEELSVEYTDLKDVKDRIEEDREKISMNYNETQRALTRALLNISRMEVTIEDLEDDIDYLEVRNQNLSSELNKVKDDAEDICSEVAKLPDVADVSEFSKCGRYD